MVKSVKRRLRRGAEKGNREAAMTIVTTLELFLRVPQDWKSGAGTMLTAGLY